MFGHVSVHLSVHRGGTPTRSGRGGGGPQPGSDGGYPGQVRTGGTPARSRWGEVPWPGPDVDTQGGVPPSRDEVPPLQLGQQKEYLLRGGRYASCVHAGGLSCG